uniref:Importin subunit alpha n=1 Tax=Ditylenchus dipsaci TaxID=166011 RepID=A0A915DE78_9BILA
MSLLRNKGLFSPHESSIFLAMLDSQSSSEAQLAASLFFRKKLASCQEPPSELIGEIITKLISCLGRSITEVQLNASWALTNLACGSRQITHRIVQLGGITALKSLAEKSTGEIRDQAVWALGNLAADCQRCRQSLPAYQQYESRKIAIWCLVNVLRSGMNEILITDVVRLLHHLHKTILCFESDEIISDSVWSIAYLIDHATLEGERITAVFDEPGLVRVLVSLLKSSCTRVLAGSLRAVGNIITGTDEQTTRMLDFDILPDLNKLMNSDLLQVSRECVWILSNIAAGTQDHISRLFSVPNMVENIFLLCNDTNPRKRKEAFWVLVNALMGASALVYEYLISGGVAHILVQILDEYLDANLVDRALHSISHSLSAFDFNPELAGTILRISSTFLQMSQWSCSRKSV